MLRGAIYVLFGPAGDDSAITEETVLVEEQPSLLRDAPQMHIVRLGAGEVGECSAKAVQRHHSQIDLQTSAEQNGGLRLTGARHLSDAGECNEMVHCRGRIGRGGNHVQIPHSLAAAPEATSDLERSDCGAFLQMFSQLRGDSSRLRVEYPFALTGITAQ